MQGLWISFQLKHLKTNVLMSNLTTIKMITDSTSRTQLYRLQKHPEQQNASGCPRAIHPALARGNFQMNAYRENKTVREEERKARNQIISCQSCPKPPATDSCLRGRRMRFPGALNLCHQCSSAWQGATLQVGRDPPGPGAASPGAFPTGNFQVQPPRGLFSCRRFPPTRTEGKEGKREIAELLGSRLQLGGIE